MGLVSELRRRNVLRMVVLYAVAAWLVSQVAEVIVTLAALPDWSGQVVLALLVIGFPIALIFSWFYELTPEGISLEKDVDRAESITHITGRRMDFIVISLLSAAVILFAWHTWWSSGPSDKSIAVLAFENMSGDPEQEYFSDGVSEELLNVLAQVPELHVIARTSAFSFKRQSLEVKEIAQRLNVAYVLEGSVRKSGNNIRVTAQLINADDGFHVWSKKYDRELDDIFTVQDEIAREVVKALEVTLLDAEEQRLAQRYQPTLEAYNALILGRYEMAKRTADSLAAAERHLKQAIELDRGYALAYVGLAETYGLQELYGGLLFEEALQRRQPLIDKALELDPLSAEALTAKIGFHRARRLKTGKGSSRREEEDAAEEEYLKVIELNPNYATAHHWYGNLLRGQGRFEEALVQLRLAAELDPMAPVIQTTVTGATWDAGHAEEALVLARKNIERSPEFPNNYLQMARFLWRLGHLGERQRWTQEALRRNPDDTGKSWQLCIGFIELDDAPSAENCARRLSEARPDKLWTHVVWAALHEYRGQTDLAIATLEYLSERAPGWPAYDRWLADVVAGQGDFKRGRRLMAGAHPEMLEDGLELAENDFELYAAMVFAAVLHANGEMRQRDILLLALEERIATMHRTRGIGYGIMDVYIHAMRGNRDRAIAGLREAVDMGWRGGNCCYAAIMVRKDWKLASLHQDPEFIAIMDELEADIRRQSQWYEDHKDDPVF